ncbi:MAG: CvpA family protein [Alphaproteobacteria bacterium]|nr:CvpA family protein [Alphaproteobacteria bacterium]
MIGDLNTIDISIILVIFISTLIGFCRGAIRELLTIVSWTGAILLTIFFFPFGKSIISNFIQQPLLVDLITYVVVFIVFLVVLSAFTYLFSNIVKNSALAIPNRLCGGIFGILRGVIILALLDFGISQYVLQEYEEYVQTSKLRPYVKETSKMMFIMLPESTRQSLLKHLSLEQQKALLDNFNISSSESSTQTIAQQLNNVSNISNEAKDNQSNNKEDTNKQTNKSKEDKYNDNKNDSKQGQTAQELSELKVKQPNSSTFFQDTKKDLDKLLDAYT